MTKINQIYTFDHTPYKQELCEILNLLHKEQSLDEDKFKKIINYPVSGFRGVFSKQQLIKGLEELQKENYPGLLADDTLIDKIKMKPMRTHSGVTPVTVLTKPFPCPGQCIFCPNDTRMPKSYLADEPGAQRALRNQFDPYLQTYDRLRAFKNIGHSTNKIELIILGGTWSFYPESYQVWFIKRCFEAMNDFALGLDNTNKFVYQGLDLEKQKVFEQVDKIIRNSHGKMSYNKLIAKINKDIAPEQRKAEQSNWEELFLEHEKNVDCETKCVGLVVETRPDNISHEEVIRIRKLGATKIQMGWQSLNDEVLALNHRGHDVEATIRAVQMVRQAGFKVHAHWMANLYGSNPQKDIEDYNKIFEDQNFRPDELKVYPCSLIESAELMDYYQKGLWRPYSSEELQNVLVQNITHTPQYCRLTRIIRDIPSTDIVVGNKTTNLRQIVENKIKKDGLKMQDIRAREIKTRSVSMEDLHLDIIDYSTNVSQEKFLQFVTEDNQIAGFLRLSLPTTKQHPFMPELNDCAMIREVHVYGVSVKVGENEEGRAQHLGLGKKLIAKAEEIAKQAGWKKLAVISAIGTRGYYSARGYSLVDMYQIKDLT